MPAWHLVWHRRKARRGVGQDDPTRAVRADIIITVTLEEDRDFHVVVQYLMKYLVYILDQASLVEFLSVGLEQEQQAYLRLTLNARIHLLHRASLLMSISDYCTV
jgi:hypothetical protein